MSSHKKCVELICTKANGVHPLRQVSAIPDGYCKNRSQIWRLSVLRARSFWLADLIDFDHRPGVGIFGHGSTRTTSKVMPTAKGRLYVTLCKEAAKLSNLSWPEEDYHGYIEWQEEWLHRRERFKQVLLAMDPSGDGR
jgi:hypothetical protein